MMKITNAILSAVCGMFIAGAPVVNAAPESSEVNNITLIVPNSELVDADTEASVVAMINNMLGHINLNVSEKEAQDILRKAETGDVESITACGFCYILGLGGIEQDIHKGMSYLVKAAQEGDEQALMMVGGMYMSGIFGEEYLMQGVRIMEVLAEKSHPYAMYMCALIHMAEGDYETSSYWYNRVISLNDPQFIQLLRLVKKSLIETAEQGDAIAQGSLAFMYVVGAFGFEENHGEAFKWCKRAAAQGEPDAILMLGSFYEEGIGTARNTQKAIYYYSKAAEMGVEGAQEALDALKTSLETTKAVIELNQ